MKAYFPASQVSWFKTTMTLTAILILVYLIFHFLIPGQERIHLNTEQLVSINSIIQDGLGEATDSQQTAIRVQLNEYLSVILDNGYASSPIVVPSLEEQLIQLEKLELKSLPTVLPTYPFQVPSIFWLHGPLVFLELFFWSLFGLGASVLYRASEAMSEGTFDHLKVPVHLAKILYAPLSTVVIFLSIEVFFRSGSIVVDDVNSWIIVLSFILGFYSGRTVELLRRLKDVILPTDGNGAETYRKEKEAVKENSGLHIEGRVSFDQAIETPMSFDYSQVMISVFQGEAHQWLVDVFPDEEGNFDLGSLTSGHYEFRADIEWGGKSYADAVTLSLDKESKSVSLLLKPFVEDVFKHLSYE